MPKRTTLKRPERVRSADRKSGVELMLTENIPSLGQQGDIVKVKAGYARNYLVPQGLGTVATAANKRAVELHRQRQQAVLDIKLANLRKLAGENVLRVIETAEKVAVRLQKARPASIKTIHQLDGKSVS